MKFGETFKEYLHGDQEWFLDKFSHVEYKRLKKVSKSCRRCRALHEGSSNIDQTDGGENPALSQFCQCQSCPAALVMIFQGLKASSPDSKCPVYREAGVYANAVHMLELDLQTKRRNKDYGKERLVAERAETVKQSKEFWESQTKYVVGY